MISVEKIFQNYAVLIPTLVIVSITGMVAFQFIWNLFEDILVNKLEIQTKWGRKKREEHDLLIKTAESLNKLQGLHKKDMERSDQHDEEMKEELVNFANEIRNTLKSQAESIIQLKTDAEERRNQISSLMYGSMELLGDKIDQRFSKYVAMKGIPENEVTEFDGLWDAYHNHLNGNHGREQKYKYVKNHLPVLPVEINPIYNDKEEK